MSDHVFKNGIRIHIPDDLSDPIGSWTNVKIAMSVLMGTEAKEPVRLFPWKGRGHYARKTITKKK